jgi:amino acid transporter
MLSVLASVMGFVLLLPFFALLIWLRLIAAPNRKRYNLQLAATSLIAAAVCCAIGMRFATPTNHHIWPQVQGALFALFVFLIVFGMGWWLDRRAHQGQSLDEVDKSRRAGDTADKSRRAGETANKP